MYIICKAEAVNRCQYGTLKQASPLVPNQKIIFESVKDGWVGKEEYELNSLNICIQLWALHKG